MQSISSPLTYLVFSRLISQANHSTFTSTVHLIPEPFFEEENAIVSVILNTVEFLLLGVELAAIARVFGSRIGGHNLRLRGVACYRKWQRYHESLCSTLD